MGTIVNTVAVLLGGFIGLLGKRFMKEGLEQAIQKVLGLCVLMIGIFGVFTAMATVDAEGKISTDGMMLLIISMVVGTLIGTLLKVEDRLNNIGNWLEKKAKIPSFSEGFVSASLLFCAGAMTIVGSINDGLYGNSEMLYIKSILDCISAIILTSTLGAGVIFSAITVLIYQGLLTLGASVLAPVLSEVLIGHIGMVGNAIVACVGLNLLGVTQIKTANILPALLIPVLYALIF